MAKKLNKYYFGIDFGTTSSATVGYMVVNHDLEPAEIQYGDEEGRPVPSVIAIERETGEVFAGRDAWDRKMELSGACEYISSVKTKLDSDFSETIAGRIWTPVDVATELFKTLKQNVYERTGSEMNEATVAIPIGFSAAKRAILRQAAKNAGIEIKSFISEPTAAFFANYDALRSFELVAVFDWGGGTLDVSILRHSEGRVSELATNVMEVAGDEIDDKIAKRLHAKIARKNNFNIAFESMPPKAQDLMRVRVEGAKRRLSDDDTAVISLNNYGKYGVCREILDYDWFADIVAPEVDSAIACLEKTIQQANVGIANIDQILLTGGSSNLRPLLNKMYEKYGDKLFFPEETMWNVAQGAARLSMTPGAYYSNQSVGLTLSNDEYFELLAPDTELNDWSVTHHFGIVDTSREARFVFSGSADINSSSEKYRTLSVPAYRFLQEQLILNAMVDHDMMFRVQVMSNMRTSEFARVWEYPKLKCYYKLPKGRDKK